MNTIPKERRSYDSSNATAARVILADVEKHGGECSGLVLWARGWVRNHRDVQDVVQKIHPGENSGQRGLFDAA